MDFVYLVLDSTGQVVRVYYDPVDAQKYCKWFLDYKVCIYRVYGQSRFINFGNSDGNKDL